jgi:hypothetical protein
MRGAAPLLAGLQIAHILGAQRRPLPRLTNRDGDPIEFAEARYTFGTDRRREVVARLDAVAALRRTGARPAKWDWVGEAQERSSSAGTTAEGLALDSHYEGDERCLVLASVKVAGDQLELSVNSRHRLESARALIEPRLSGLLGEPDITLKSVEDGLAESGEEPPPRRSVSKRVEREVMQRFLDGHYRRWLDEKIPALGGRSPREAAREFDGREQLVELLKELENREAHRARETGAGYDARWLWRELGIENLRR